MRFLLCALLVVTFLGLLPAAARADDVILPVNPFPCSSSTSMGCCANCTAFAWLPIVIEGGSGITPVREPSRR